MSERARPTALCMSLIFFLALCGGCSWDRDNVCDPEGYELPESPSLLGAICEQPVGETMNVHLSWSPGFSSGCGQELVYHVRRRALGETDWVILTDDAGVVAANWSDRLLTTGATAWSYSVCAEDECLARSPWCDPLEVTDE